MSAKKGVHVKSDMEQCFQNNVNPADMIRNSITLLSNYYHNTDISVIVVNGINVCMIDSTVGNEDNRMYIIREFQAAITKNLNLVSFPIHNRMGVQQTTIIPLSIGNFIFGYMVLEKHNALNIDYTGDYPLFLMITLALRIYCLELDKSQNIRTDSFTRLLLRDSLIADLKKLVAGTNDLSRECLATIYISNIEQLNQSKGIEKTDQIIYRVARKLSESHLSAYRVGGAKFSVLVHQDIIDANAFLEKLLDMICSVEKDIIISIILTPVKEDIYESLYLCEKYIKTAKEDVVTIIREDPTKADWESYLQISNMYVPKEENIIDLDISESMISIKTIEDEEKPIITVQPALFQEQELEREETLYNIVMPNTLPLKESPKSKKEEVSLKKHVIETKIQQDTSIFVAFDFMNEPEKSKIDFSNYNFEMM